MPFSISEFRDGNEGGLLGIGRAGASTRPFASSEGSHLWWYTAQHSSTNVEPSKLLGDLIKLLSSTLIQMLDFVKPRAKIREAIRVFAVAFLSELWVHTSFDGIMEKIVIHERHCSSEEVVSGHHVQSKIHERTGTLFETKNSHPCSVFPV
ncbi:hypothetical protein BDN71DRAFT_1436159 [Pleurotus eryngii]|uniref:Uncharacterized protein n=1 Tax=Pleurotus eryngii TaxID=5323 RepID=A0A9P5ZM95_PLEER|nr:hypothetical protein BDN71DRAFT_1436159 [Pleurotus eryngii]